jgi:hypothetical protein
MYDPTAEAQNFPWCLWRFRIFAATNTTGTLFSIGSLRKLQAVARRNKIQEPLLGSFVTRFFDDAAGSWDHVSSSY